MTHSYDPNIELHRVPAWAGALLGLLAVLALGGGASVFVHTERNAKSAVNAITNQPVNMTVSSTYEAAQ